MRPYLEKKTKKRPMLLDVAQAGLELLDSSEPPKKLDYIVRHGAQPIES